MKWARQLHGITLGLTSALLLGACATRDQPRTAEDAMAESRARQAEQNRLSSAGCTNEFGDPVYQSPTDQRLNGDICHPRPLIVQQRRTAPSQDQQPAATVQRVPESINLPPAPVPLGGLGGIGILR